MIATECFPDTFLLKELHVGRKEIRHVGTKGKVVNFTRDNPGSLGIIDQDPDSAQPRELMAFHQVDAFGDLSLIQKENGSEIIIISPRLEEWFFKRARMNHLKPDDFDLPKEPDRLHSIIHYEKKRGFQQLLQTLIDTDPEMAELRVWIHRHQERNSR